MMQTPQTDDHGVVVDHMEWVHADYELRATPVATAELEENIKPTSQHQSRTIIKE